MKSLKFTIGNVQYVEFIQRKFKIINTKIIMF